MINEERPAIKTIRNVNQENVIRTIIEKRKTTRRILAEETRVSLMTVKNIVDNLLDIKIIVEENINDYGLLGRKPKILSLDPRIGLFVCLNLSFKDFFVYYIYSIHQELIIERKLSRDEIKSYSENLVKISKSIKDDVNKTEMDILAIGILVPGAYYEEEDTVNFDLISGLKQLPIKRFFSIEFGFENIAVFHDVFAGAQAEYEATLPRNDSLFYFFAGDGVGGAFVNGNGSWLRGENLLAGEIGQNIIWDGEKETIFEDTVSTYKLTEKIQSAHPGIDFWQAMDLYDKGDRIALEVINRAATIAANCLHNVIWTLNPGRLIIASPYPRYAEIVLEACKKMNQRFAGLSIPMTVEMLMPRYKNQGEVTGCFALSLKLWIDSIADSLN